MIPLPPARRWGDRYPVSRAFIVALLLSIGTVLNDPYDRRNWMTACGILAAAVSSGVRKNHP